MEAGVGQAPQGHRENAAASAARQTLKRAAPGFSEALRQS
jgi:hypothetical protein